MSENIIEYLWKCVKEKPHKRALAIRDHSISFLELDIKARQYGSLIMDIYKGSPCPIGVFCDRDIEPIIAFLGVVYSGNFYVPLDPNAPVKKLEDIVDNAGIKIIVGIEEQKEIIKNISFRGTFITPNSLSNNTYNLVNFEKKDYRKDSPLYMVYTSGSTGMPKGVLKSHKAEISFIESYCNTFCFSEDDIIGNQTPFYFDAAAKDIFLMLKITPKLVNKIISKIVNINIINPLINFFILNSFLF